jgi:hypothetical protein
LIVGMKPFTLLVTLLLRKKRKNPGGYRDPIKVVL